MKRSKIYILPMLLVMAFLMFGCTKKKEEKTLNCDELYSNYYDAVIAFSASPTEATCTAFENAVVELLNNCSLYAGVNEAELQQWLDENDCSQYSK